MVREVREKERERRALLSFVGWPVSFVTFDVGHGGLVERGCTFLSFGPPSGVYSCGRILNALI